MTERIGVWTYPESEELSPETATAATGPRMWIETVGWSLGC
jgi:hypothetical protein